MDLTWEQHAATVERLLGHSVEEPVDLGGSSRTVVWRVRAGGASYVVKVHREEEAAGYARECSALEVLTGTGTVPALVGHDDASRTIVMEDLGAGEHLAHALLGDAAPVARRRLHGWVDALAALHAAATPARVGAFADAVARRGASAVADIEEQPGTAAERYAEVLPELGVDGLDAVLAALRQVPDLFSDELVISPGDVCPDNNAEVGERVVLLDLEGAQLLHPAWDLAYLTVPWPSCWCSWAMPGAEVDAAVARYAAATRAGTERRRVLGEELAVTTLVWSVVSPGWFLPRALDPAPDESARPEVPGRRAMVMHRLALAAAATPPRPLAVLPDFAGRLHAALERRWGDVRLPLGPVWRGTTLAP
ncbi:hypothetical protein [Nocardioides aequoreus]|uniref:hypothetical protein n=1 Tax=Nocardioides aequoreus TaxID=397278 RepID=UPI0004C34037|nr:hypothetical protein [Nocardioides aequoreus]